MKKMLLTVAIAMVSLYASAQESENSDFKPTKGSFATELNFNPFQGNLKFNNVLNQVKGRYFLSPQLALRLGFNINLVDSTLNFGTPYGSQASFNNDKRTSNSFGLNFGIEKHFKGTKRLSPYIGVDAFWGTKGAKQELSTNAGTTTVKNAWITTQYIQSPNPPYYYNTITSITETAYNKFGVMAVAGFDFYMAKNFFLGYEFNLGYSKTSYKTPEVTSTGQGSTQNNFYTDISSSKFGTSLVNGIRVGYSF